MIRKDVNKDFSWVSPGNLTKHLHKEWKSELSLGKQNHIIMIPQKLETCSEGTEVQGHTGSLRLIQEEILGELDF